MIAIPYHTRRLIASHPLTRDQKWRAYIRFISWQLESRVRRSHSIHRWIGDSRFLVKRGDYGLTGNIYFGLHEFDDMGFLLHLLRAEDTFIDVGANQGSYSILAGKVVGATGKAFEPVPETFSRLRKNPNLNDIDQQVIAVNKAVGHAPGVIPFSSDCDTTNHALLPEERRENAIEVIVTTLDEELEGMKPTLIKIDVEGYEHSVLRGAYQTLENDCLKALIVEIDRSNRYGTNSSDSLHILNEHGFKPFQYDPLTRKLTELDLPANDAANTIFVRDVEWVRHRTQTARPFSALGQSA